MSHIIFLVSLFLAAIFAIFAYSGAGMNTSKTLTWIDIVFWAIIGAGAVPLVIEFIATYLEKLKNWLGRQIQKTTRPHISPGGPQ